MALSDIGNGFSFKILFLNRYCKTVYPSKDVRNVVEANDRVLVDNSMVTPYRCLGELFTHCTGKFLTKFQGSYRSWKVLEFYSGIFLEKGH